MNKINIVLVLTVLFIGVSASSFAMMCDMGSGSSHGAAHAEGAQKESVAVEAGNEICPVSGERIKEGEAVKVEHEGKIYNLCCKMCVKDFKKNPKKYIEKLEVLEEKGHEGHHHQ